MSIFKKIKNLVTKSTMKYDYRIFYNQHFIDVKVWNRCDLPSKQYEAIEKMKVLVDIDELQFILNAFHGDVYAIHVKDAVSGKTEDYYIHLSQGRLQLVGNKKITPSVKWIYDTVIHRFLTSTGNDVPLYRQIHHVLDKLNETSKPKFTYTDYIRILNATQDDPDKIMERYGKYCLNLDIDVIYGIILPHCQQYFKPEHYQVMIEMMHQYHLEQIEKRIIGDA